MGNLACFVHLSLLANNKRLQRMKKKLPKRLFFAFSATQRNKYALFERLISPFWLFLLW